MTIVIIILLLIAVITSISYSLLLKRDIGQINKALLKILKADTNIRLTTDTFDRHITSLVCTANDILDKQKKLMIISNRSNKELRRAITNVSHDLRTPLTSALGYVQMLESAKIPDTKKTEYIAIIESRLIALSALMQELFDFSQIIEGNIELQINKINICNPLRDVISIFYEDFISRNIIPQIVIPETPVYAYCDKVAINRIIQNLIHNAIVHGTGSFRIVVEDDRPIIRFENGVIDAESIEKERIFDRFYTSNSSRSNQSTGLGLAIAKELIERMGGQITAHIQDSVLIISIFFINQKPV